ncbi:hypothetical protein [Falsibacillus pallidus]|uniref:Uncharacterized protein n=1 Tax=Falsibacillus pallidus TaxID=493781 RepID=A0A370GQD5_9BACI|nr:hypothetical protein [Falsibacillus pallidus]RDI45609.1 hypothetical protein DFR59_102238 [Falsibacillus pallidus]
MSDHHDHDESLDEQMIEEIEVDEGGETTTCVSIVHQNVCVEALVTIKPRVTIGDRVKIKCGKTHISKNHNDPHSSQSGPKTMRKATSYDLNCHHEDDCTFSVSQELCIAIPLVFSADAFVKPDKVACDKPGLGPCSHYDEDDAGRPEYDEDDDY